jgi:hypothetical protein
MTTQIWYSGVDKHYKHTYTPDPEGKMNSFHTELQDIEFPVGRTLSEAINDILSKRQTKFVEILFSGGLDSECAMNMCLANNIPVRAVTMKLHINGIVVNTQDLYYSEKYCRENHVEQKIIDLNIATFFENGDFASYLDPYRMTVPHAATHFWLLEQCTGYPVLGGDYNWPWAGTGHHALSPARHSISCYSRFMEDKGIDGVGHLMNATLETNLMLIREHVRLIENDTVGAYGPDHRVIYLKKHIYENLGSKPLDPRMRSFGWESIDSKMFNRLHYRQIQLDKFGDCKLSMAWGHKVAEVIGGEPGFWDRNNWP